MGAKGLKDMGKVMAVLKDKFAGQMDFTRASAVVKQNLAQV
ncbi:MAG: GatB/YqeY domain-containing protein [Rhodospirillaceae bacterium]|nr:GatB/YqeY domain-containing protein [Rhodospirillaceae bacterium]